MKIRRKIELELKLEKGKLDLIQENIKAYDEKVGKTQEDKELNETYIQLKYQTERIISIYEDLLKYED